MTKLQSILTDLGYEPFPYPTESMTVLAIQSPLTAWELAFQIGAYMVFHEMLDPVPVPKHPNIEEKTKTFFWQGIPFSRSAS